MYLTSSAPLPGLVAAHQALQLQSDMPEHGIATQRMDGVLQQYVARHSRRA